MFLHHWEDVSPLWEIASGPVCQLISTFGRIICFRKLYLVEQNHSLYPLAYRETPMV